VRTMGERRPTGLSWALAAAVLALTVGSVLAVGLHLRADGAAREARNARLAAEIAALYRRAGDIEAATLSVRRHWADYETLAARGFTAPPSLVRVTATLDDLAVRHRINRLTYRFDGEARPGRHDRPGARTMTLAMDVRATLDGDVLAFVRAIPGAFPGAARLRDFTMKRIDDPTTETLAAIRRGRGVDLVAASLTVDWHLAESEGAEAALR